jgi:site-specific recombinase XerD
MDNNLKIHFYLKSGKLNAKDQAPIYLRLTLNGQRTEISINQSVSLDNWNKHTERAKGNREEARILNNYLDSVYNKVNQHFNELIRQEEYLSVEDLKNDVIGKGKANKTLVQAYEESIKLMKQEEGSKYVNHTIRVYEITIERLKEFIRNEFRVQDIALEKLNYQFMQQYEIFLRTKHHCQHNTVMKYLKQLKKIIHQAMSYGYLHRDPFSEYVTSYKETYRGYLTQGELDSIENKDIKIERLRVVRDIFLFMCYTGLSYADLARLTPADISTGIDGGKWIISERNKTGIRFSVPLLPKALDILEKYQDHPERAVRNTILPMRSNQKLNSYLQEIADICGIIKNLTCHIARHTFATTVTLTNGVPIETVSKMLGHKNLHTTQIYSKVIDKKISEDMEDLKKRLVS